MRNLELYSVRYLVCMLPARSELSVHDSAVRSVLDRVVHRWGLMRSWEGNAARGMVAAGYVHYSMPPSVGSKWVGTYREVVAVIPAWGRSHRVSWIGFLLSHKLCLPVRMEKCIEKDAISDDIALSWAILLLLLPPSSALICTH